MTKRLSLVAMTVGALTVPAVAARHGDRDPNPRAIAYRSIHRINRIVHHVVPTMHRRARRCAMAITHLLENEEPDRAAELAERCIGAINHMADRGSEVIGQIAQRAVNALTELEAPEGLIEAVQAAAERGLNAIEEHRAMVIQRIEDALAGTPPG